MRRMYQFEKFYTFFLLATTTLTPNLFLLKIHVFLSNIFGTSPGILSIFLSTYLKFPLLLYHVLNVLGHVQGRIQEEKLAT